MTFKIIKSWEKIDRIQRFSYTCDFLWIKIRRRNSYFLCARENRKKTKKKKIINVVFVEFTCVLAVYEWIFVEKKNNKVFVDHQNNS